MLLASGMVMVFTLWFSKKAHRVIQTSINLASTQTGEQEQFGASLPGRMIVRAAVGMGTVISQIMPGFLQRGIASRFVPAPQKRHDSAALRLCSRFDQSRAVGRIDCLCY